MSNLSLVEGLRLAYNQGFQAGTELVLASLAAGSSVAEAASEAHITIALMNEVKDEANVVPR